MQTADNPKPLSAETREKMERFRAQLLEAGFTEATQNALHFWKNLTEKTAFIVNLKTVPAGVGVVYGVMSTAILWTAGDWDFFKQHGSSDDDCNLRFYQQICSETDEAEACSVIGSLYEQYRHTDKDTLLAVVKERRKQFIQQITNVLKPLGFRKKGNQWRKPLSENIMLQFWADKSPYADLYYFEVDIYAQNPPGGVWCYTKRLDTKGTDIFDRKGYSEPHRRFDWQLQSTEDLLEIVKRAYEEELRPLLETDLTELGKQPFVWQGCICQRKHCPTCWVEKNLWEAKQN